MKTREVTAAYLNIPAVSGTGWLFPNLDRTKVQECRAGTEILQPLPNIKDQHIPRTNANPKQNTLLYLVCHNCILISILWKQFSLVYWQHSRGTELWFGQRALIPGYLKCNIWCH